jgi:hypothetical protein
MITVRWLLICARFVIVMSNLVFIYLSLYECDCFSVSFTLPLTMGNCSSYDPIQPAVGRNVDSEGDDKAADDSCTAMGSRSLSSDPYVRRTDGGGNTRPERGAKATVGACTVSSSGPPSQLSDGGNAQSEQCLGYEEAIRDFCTSVEAHCAIRLALDDSRRQFVRDQARTTYQLLADRLVNCSRFRRCLLGRKSVGKTMLLWTLCSAFKELCPRLPGYSNDGLEVIFLSCEQQTDRTPRCAVALALKLDDGSSWDTVVEYMRDNNKKVLLVIDELQIVYNSDLFTNGIEFIKDIARIGGDKEGLFHCLLSGSSSDLRRLLSAKLSMEEAKEKNLGNYAKVDLNATKFQACTIAPFLREEHLSTLVDHLAHKHRRTERYNLDRVFMETAGSPGVLDEYIRNWPNNTPGDNYATGVRSLSKDTVEFKLLAQLFSAVRELKSMRSLSP